MSERDSIITATSNDTFDATLTLDDRPVLVDFTASWCAPCQQLHPHLVRLAEDQTNRLRIVTVDVDTDFEPALRHSVHSMPTLLLFDGATLLARLPGEPAERLGGVSELLDGYDRARSALRTPAPPATPRPARMLHFGTEPPLGVSLRLVPPAGPLSEAVAVELRGDIEVPADWWTELTVRAILPDDLFDERPELLEERFSHELIALEGRPDLEALTRFGPHDIDIMNLWYSKFGDEDLGLLLPLSGLRDLHLGRPALTAEGLNRVAAMPGLRWLIIGDQASGGSPDEQVIERMRRTNPWLAVNESWTHPALVR